MRKRLSQGLRGDVANTEGCEFAEEAKPVEGLKLLPADLLRNALDSEFARVCRSPIDGMYVMPSATDPHNWFGLLFVRRGVFGGGIFRFTLHIQEDFPNSREMPEVVFDLDIFHPNVDMKTRRLDMKRYFPDGWKKGKHHMLNVLLVVQRVFFSLETDCEYCVNAEAAILWKEHSKKFRELSKECVNRSRAQIYDDPSQNDENAIRLTPWDPSVHESVRERMLLGGVPQGESVQWGERADKQRGFSWVDTEKMTYMTEPVSSRIDYSQEMRAEQDRMAFGIERLDLSGVAAEESPVNSCDTKGEEGEELSLPPSEFPSSDDCVSHPKLERTNGIKEQEKEQITLHADAGESDI